MIYIDRRDGKLIDIHDCVLCYIMPSDLKHLQPFETAFKGDKIIENENTNNSNKRGDRPTKRNSKRADK